MIDLYYAEDDPNIANTVKEYLEQKDFKVTIYDTLASIKQALEIHVPAMVLLDWNMPDGRGDYLCKWIRGTWKELPIIFLTVRGDSCDIVSGFQNGADDYVVKPFEMKELIARINAVLRRTEIPNDTSKKLHFDKLTIDLDSYELIVDGKKIDTPPKELELLYHLASTPNRVYTRNQLLDEVWGFDYFGDSRTVDVHIKRLREKVEGVSDQWALKTVWGVGYKFETVGGQTADKAK